MVLIMMTKTMMIMLTKGDYAQVNNDDHDEDDGDDDDDDDHNNNDCVDDDGDDEEDVETPRGSLLWDILTHDENESAVRILWGKG